MDALRFAATTVGAGLLELRYELEADLAALAIPSQAPAPLRIDELWKHSCFELFVCAAPLDAALGPDQPYLEFNLSPSGCWAGYRFEGYRRSQRLARVLAEPHIRLTRSSSRRLVLEARADLRDLPLAGDRSVVVRLGATAVIERHDGTLDYWAVRHPGERPDFHDAGGWVLPLRLALTGEPDGDAALDSTAPPPT